MICLFITVSSQDFVYSLQPNPEGTVKKKLKYQALYRPVDHKSTEWLCNLCACMICINSKVHIGI